MGAFNFSGSRSGFLPNFHDPQSQQQQSQMNWPLNFNQSSSSSSWMMDDETQRHLNLAGSSSQQTLDSNHNTAGGGDGRSFLLLLIFLIFFFCFAHSILLLPLFYDGDDRINNNVVCLFQGSINLKRPAQHPIGVSR